MVGKKRLRKSSIKTEKVDTTASSEVIIDKKYKIKNVKQINIEMNEYNNVETLLSIVNMVY